MEAKNKQYLLRLARLWLKKFLSPDEKIMEPSLPLKSDLNELQRKSGGFVTIHLTNGKLRGCIGTVSEEYSRIDLVKKMVIAAASQDPRFPPVNKNEFDDLVLEISLLEAPRRLQSLEKLQIGRDGLIIEKGYKRGLLLPQVASEMGWDAKTFFNRTLEKAGLSPRQESWESVKTYYFSAFHFSE